MSRRTALVVASLVLVLPATVAAQDLRPHTLESGVVRVCADPDNLPASNEKGEGYENRIAELLAKSWNAKLEYAWWPVRRGFFGRALNGRYCDIAITAPAGLDTAGVTRPYYRSSYVIVTRKDSGLDLTSLADSTFRRLRIGVHLLNSDAENTPPAMALSKFGVVGNLVGFNTFFSTAGDRPEDIFRALADGKIDVAIVWGPLAGYFAPKMGVPMEFRPVAEKEVDGIPFAFSLGMATRRRERGLRDSLQAFLDQHQGAITGILKDFGVPTVPEEPQVEKQTGAAR